MSYPVLNSLKNGGKVGMHGSQIDVACSTLVWTSNVKLYSKIPRCQEARNATTSNYLVQLWQAGKK